MVDFFISVVEVSGVIAERGVLPAAVLKDKGKKAPAGPALRPELLGNLLNQAQQLRAGLLSICQLALRWEVHQELAGFAGLQ